MMPASMWSGILGVLFGGIMTASFALPMKFARRWRWENVWLIYSAVSLVVMPPLVALATVPHLVDVYQDAPGRVLALTASFGFAWGIANVLFGLAVPIVGVALSFSVVVGMSAALGSLIPLILLTPARLFERSGALILAGLLLTVAGVALLGFAGHQRERLQAKDHETAGHASALTGLLLCICSGLLAPMLNFGFAFGSDISQAALRHGARLTGAANAIWVVALAGGFLSNGGYALYRLASNRTWKDYRRPGTGSHWVLTVMMGLLWTGGLVLYGRGANMLGDLGAAVGWPVYEGAMILTSTLLGAATGEWKGADRVFVRRNCLGLLGLIAAIVVLSIGNRS